MIMEFILLIVVIILSLICLRAGMIQSYKIGYYEQKLKDRNVDMDKVKNMKFLDIWRL